MIGYSDVTALLIALTSAKGWITFYGPALMSQIGEYPGPQPFTLAQMLRVLCEDCSGLALPDATERTNQFLDWGKDEAYQRARDMQPNPGREVWRSRAAQGVLFGGNLETLNFLVGTPWLAVPDDTILYIEATEAEAHPARFHRALTHFRQCGLLDRVRGVLVGHSPDAKPIAGESLRTVVCDALEGLNGPIIGELSFGHVDPMLTLPNGCRINVDANDEGAQLTLIESAVSLI